MSAADKRRIAEQLLERGLMHVHIDPRRPGVVVPERFTHQPSLILAYGRSGLRVPIDDLVIDDDGIRATLSFSNTPFACTVPWSSVFALVDVAGRGKVFTEDVPPDHSVNEECGFCLVPQARAKLMVAGPNAYICDACVDIHRPRGFWRRVRAWLTRRESRPRRGARTPYRDAGGSVCAFCGHAAEIAVEGAKAKICAPCLDLAADVVAERRVASRMVRA